MDEARPSIVRPSQRPRCGCGWFGQDDCDLDCVRPDLRLPPLPPLPPATADDVDNEEDPYS